MSLRTSGVFRPLLALAALAVLLAGVLIGSPDDAPPRGVVGEQERIRISGPDGEEVEVEARIDTGASSSSIDEEVAEDLGFDLDEADTVTVGSALGRDERPVIIAGIRLAGTDMPARMTVADRSERSNLVLLGRPELSGYTVEVGERRLTSPDGPGALSTLLLRPPTAGPWALLASVVLAALITSTLNVIYRARTLGTSTTVLLTLACVHSGIGSVTALTLVFIFGMLALRPVQRRFRWPQVATLVIPVSGAAVALIAVAPETPSAWWPVLPVLGGAVAAERFSREADAGGVRSAAASAGVTLAVAVVGAVVLMLPSVREILFTAPLAVTVACAIWALLIVTRSDPIPTDVRSP